MSKSVLVYEVGPRDGLQYEKKILSVPQIVEFIQRLADTGLKAIESGSFVSPKAIPQMANTRAVLEQLPRKMGIRYPVLVPNNKGLEAALAVGVQDVAVFTAVSDSFTKANIGCTVEESLGRFEPIYRQPGIRVRAYISCSMGCPYEGKVAVSKVAELAERLYRMGSDVICLADTIGAGKPEEVPVLVKAVASAGVPIEKIALHFHDTLERLAIQKIEKGLSVGIRMIDSAIGNLGGCPYAPGASGNVATEEVVEKLHALGFKTGVDLKKLVAVRDWIVAQLHV